MSSSSFEESKSKKFLVITTRTYEDNTKLLTTEFAKK